MEKLDMKSMKFLIAVVLVCVIFVAFLPLAYNSLPKQEDQEIKQNVAELNASQYMTPDDLMQHDEDAEVETEQQNMPVDMAVSGRRAKSYKSEDNIEEQMITEPVKVLAETDVFQKAADLRKQEKYESAVYEYQQAAKNTGDIEVQAKCYTEIANTYASMKRYGTALSYSQKAYNTKPTTERELIMARLYYKTGNIEKATEHVNDILKRDFVEE